MPEHYILGIDTGGTMARAAVFDMDGTEVASARHANNLRYPEPGHTEVDAEEVWRSACHAVRKVPEVSGIRPDEVLGVSTTGHGNGLYAVDSTGRPVAPGIISTDSRAASIGAGWEAAGQAGFAQSVIMQRYWSGQTLPLLGWFTPYRPHALDRATALFGSKDHIRARLTGDLSAEVTEAAVSGLDTGQYASTLFERFGLTALAEKLPPIRPSLEVAAGISAEAAAATGLRMDTPVVRGLTDVVACAVASGVTSTDVVSVIADKRDDDILFLPVQSGGPGGAPAGLVGLKASHDKGDVMRAVFEGIAFAHKLDAGMTGPDAATPAWCGLRAGRRAAPLGRRSSPMSSTSTSRFAPAANSAHRARPCAWRSRSGRVGSLADAVERMVRVERRYRPDPKRRDAYRAKFARFEAVVHALAPRQSLNHVD